MSDFLRQALVIRLIREESSPALNGVALARLRKAVWSGEVGSDVQVSVEATLAEIESLGVKQMPPPTELVSVLVETLSQRLEHKGVKGAWESIGVNGRTGEQYLGRSSKAVSWPIWKTLKDAALNPVSVH